MKTFNDKEERAGKLNYFYYDELFKNNLPFWIRGTRLNSIIELDK